MNNREGGSKKKVLISRQANDTDATLNFNWLSEFFYLFFFIIHSQE